MWRISASQNLTHSNSPSQQFPSAQPNSPSPIMNFFIIAIFCSIAALAFAEDTLRSDQEITIDNGKNLRSADGRFTVEVQRDGNLVMFNNIEREKGKVQWTSGTAGSGAYGLFMLGNGDLVMLNDKREVKWKTSTYDAGSYVQLQNDGNLVINSPKGYSVWTSAFGYAGYPKP